MCRASILAALVLLAVSVQAQMPDLGETTDTVKEEFGPVAWFVITVCIGACVVFWYVIRSMYEQRLKEKDAEIQRLRSEYKDFKDKKDAEDKKIEDMLKELTLKLS